MIDRRHRAFTEGENPDTQRLLAIVKAREHDISSPKSKSEAKAGGFETRDRIYFGEFDPMQYDRYLKKR